MKNFAFLISFLLLLSNTQAHNFTFANDTNCGYYSKNIIDDIALSDDLWNALINLDAQGVKAAIKAGADVNADHAKWGSPLNYAASLADGETISTLIAAKANVNAEHSTTKFTPLISASVWGNSEGIRLLLAAGANVNANALGGSVLTYSFGSSSAKNIKMILDAGADVKTPIAYSTITTDVMVAFVTNYKSPEERMEYLQSNLENWASAGIAVLPKWVTDANIEDFSGVDECLGLLLKAGANINGVQALTGSKFKKCALAFAIENINTEMVDALKKAGADEKCPGVKEAIAVAKANDKPTPLSLTAANPDKIKVIYDFPKEGRNSNGAGYSANMSLLASKPKRVALISYYVYDAGSGKAQGGNFQGSASTTVWRTPDYAGQTHVDGFYKQSIEPMKAAFKEQGIDLLTPAEFLDTDEKRAFYNEFDQASAKREKSVTMLGKMGTLATVSDLKVCPTGQGYRPFFVCNEELNQSAVANFQGGVFSANRKLTSSLGYELCQGLGVDAVVVVYIATRQPKYMTREFAVNAVNTIMLGPNPGKSDEGSEDAKNLGQFYCGTRTHYAQPEIFQFEKAKAKFNGIENILVAHAKKMGAYINGKGKD